MLTKKTVSSLQSEMGISKNFRNCRVPIFMEANYNYVISADGSDCDDDPDDEDDGEYNF